MNTALGRRYRYPSATFRLLTKRFRPGCSGGPRLPFLPAGLLLLSCLFISFVAVPDDAAVPANEAPQFTLTYRPDGFALSSYVSLESREVDFKQEPDFGDHPVVRGAIPTGTGPAEFIGFAWDQADDVLYVDTNQNLDLTDEADQPYDSTRSLVGNKFRGIRVTRDQEGISIPYVLDLEFMGTWLCEVTVTSGWRTEAEIGGIPYVIELVDNLDGSLGEGDSLHVSRWEISSAEKDRTLQAVASSPFSADIGGIPEFIAAEGVTHSIQKGFVQTSDGAAIQITLHPADGSLGELSIQGEHIQELVLGKNNRPSVLYLSGNPIRVPAGTYSVHSATLEGGWTTDLPQSGQAALVQVEGSATLRVGGPLKQDVSVSRSGNTLTLEYIVTGAGGEVYRQPEATLDPPQFAVYRGETCVATGQFEYG
ncbi:MAG: hypothetical protein IT364_01540 [Candidatus Hydrogenedentes bacterium]|nr:hypothetical protein [Candidatus Hydrogenedentota bacterium]